MLSRSGASEKVRIILKDGLPRKDGHRLLELDGDLLQVLRKDDLAVEREELMIKGEDEDEVFLCSTRHTWRVREVHTSNTLLVLDWDSTNVGENQLKLRYITNTPLEAVRSSPQLERLCKWLDACPFDGFDKMPNKTHLMRLERDYVLGTIQASNFEILEALKRLGAILIDDHYRVLGAEMQCRFFRILFASMTLAEINLNRDPITIPQVCAAFEGHDDEFPTFIIKHLVQLYAQRIEEMTELFHWDGLKTCRFFAQELLKARPMWPRSSEFMNSWRQLTGDFEPTLDMLDGMALLEFVPGDDGQRITFLPSSSLPIDPQARIARLFEYCPRWEVAKLGSFIEESAHTLGIGTMDLIVKFARISIDKQGRRIATPLVAS